MEGASGDREPQGHGDVAAGSARAPPPWGTGREGSTHSAAQRGRGRSMAGVLEGFFQQEEDEAGAVYLDGKRASAPATLTPNRREPLDPQWSPQAWNVLMMLPGIIGRRTRGRRGFIVRGDPEPWVLRTAARGRGDGPAKTSVEQENLTLTLPDYALPSASASARRCACASCDGRGEGEGEPRTVAWTGQKGRDPRKGGIWTRPASGSFLPFQAQSTSVSRGPNSLLANLN